MYIMHFVYLFVSWWTLVLLLPFGYFKFNNMPYLTQYILNIISTCNSESGVYFTVTAPFNSDQPHFKCSIVACGQASEIGNPVKESLHALFPICLCLYSLRFTICMFFPQVLLTYQTFLPWSNIITIIYSMLIKT